MAVEPVSQSEFNSFRTEMVNHMRAQTELMRQMVELQTKHNNLESLVQRNTRDIETLEQRVLPIEQDKAGFNIRTQYNRNLIWLLLTTFMGIAGYVLRGGL